MIDHDRPRREISDDFRKERVGYQGFSVDVWQELQRISSSWNYWRLQTFLQVVDSCTTTTMVSSWNLQTKQLGQEIVEKHKITVFLWFFNGLQPMSSDVDTKYTKIDGQWPTLKNQFALSYPRPIDLHQVSPSHNAKLVNSLPSGNLT